MTWYSFTPLILQKLIWIPTRLSLRFFGRLQISGLENLKDLKGNVIFACNHESELDPFFVPASLPFFSRYSPIFYVTREKSFYDESGWRQLFYGGIFFRMWGGYPAFVGLKDYEKSIKEHIRIVNEGCSMCVFPEGGKTHDGKLQPAKGGIAYLSERTGRPIIPVAISGTYQTSAKKFFTRNRHMKIIFGKPIYPKELAGFMQDAPKDVPNKYKVMAQGVMDRISGMLKAN